MLRRLHIKLLPVIAALLLIALVAFYLSDPWLRGSVASFMTYSESQDSMTKEETAAILNGLINARNEAILRNDDEALKKTFDLEGDSGMRAYKHEVQRMNYLSKWSEKQGVRITEMTSKAVVSNVTVKEEVVSASFLVSTTFTYVYIDLPKTENIMRVGTYHDIDIKFDDGRWLIIREKYKDQADGSLNLETINTTDNRSIILSKEAGNFTTENERRMNAVAYSNQYTGAADSGENGYSYNKVYGDKNSKGGDCANFVSQALFEGGKFEKTRTWHSSNEGTRNWHNAGRLTKFLLDNGRGTVFASGTYSEVLEASYNLLPGDVIAYEQNDDICHVSLVVGADAHGYTVINCHNVDRYHVPWDMGWSRTGMKFYFIRIHYE